MARQVYPGFAAIWSARVLSLAGCLAVLAGLIFTRVWQGLRPPVTNHNLVILCAIVVIALVLGRLARWTLASALGLVGALLLTRFVGIGPLLAALLLVAASAVLGTKICRRCDRVNSAIATLVGLAVLAGVTGWLLPFPIHYFVVYLGVLGGVVAWGHRDLKHVFKLICDGWRDAVASAPRHASIAMVAAVMSAIALCAPSIQFDDMALHMLMSEQLVATGYYKMDVASQIWACAPWASDIIQSYIAVLSGNEARGAANLIWFGLTMVLVWSLGEELDLPPSLRWLAVALYASLPIVVSLNGSMQADTAITTVTMALTVLVARMARTHSSESLIPFFIISGLAVALKVTQGLLVFPLALVAMRFTGWRAFFAQAIRLFIPALLIAGSSYFYAFYITGNPVFPIFNGVFKSPYAPPHNFDDPRWHQGLSWNSLWRLTFETENYLEALPGAIGFSMLAMSGAAIWTLIIPRIRWITLALFVTAIGMFFGIQYARYVAPIIPALVTLGLCAWDRAKMSWPGEIVLVAMVMLNIVCMPLSLYIYNYDLYWRLLSQIDRQPGMLKENIEQGYGAAELVFAKYLDTAWPNGYSVFLSDPQRPFVAPFAGRAFNASPYDSTFHAAAPIADLDESGATWTGIFERTGMSHVLTSGNTSVAVMASLKQIHAVPGLVVGDLTLWRLCKADCANQVHTLIDERDISRRMIRSRSYLSKRLGLLGSD